MQLANAEHGPRARNAASHGESQLQAWDGDKIMPNHFTTVGLCGRDYSRMEQRLLPNGEVDEVSFASLLDANLCDIIKPLPEELQCIVASNPPCRYVHKETGAINQDCNGVYGEDANQWKKVDLTEEEASVLLKKYNAVTWYEWQREQWGTKWGTYGTKVHELGGDVSPVLIEFQSAWGPPSAKMMRMIDDYLCKEYCLKNITWIGYDPCDGTTVEIEIADPVVTI